MPDLVVADDAASTPRPTRLRRIVRSIAVVIAIVFVAAACSSDGYPISYDDQVDEATGLSNVEGNWKAICEPGIEEELADQAVSICACSYADIKADVPFDAFVAYNSQMSDNPRGVMELYNAQDPTAVAIVDIVRNCIARA